jgi:hypothetical protein
MKLKSCQKPFVPLSSNHQSNQHRQESGYVGIHLVKGTMPFDRKSPKNRHPRIGF